MAKPGKMVSNSVGVGIIQEYMVMCGGRWFPGVVVEGFDDFTNEVIAYLTGKEGSNARDLRADDTLWLGYYEKNQDHSDELILREDEWSKIQTLIREFKSGEWLTKRQSGQLKTLAEFKNERQFVTKGKDWCDEWAMGKQTQQVVEYAGGCFIYVADDGQYLLTIGSEESISPSLALLEFDLYYKWYLNEIAA